VPLGDGQSYHVGIVCQGVISAQLDQLEPSSTTRPPARAHVRPAYPLEPDRTGLAGLVEAGDPNRTGHRTPDRAGELAQFVSSRLGELVGLVMFSLDGSYRHGILVGTHTGGKRNETESTISKLRR